MLTSMVLVRINSGNASAEKRFLLKQEMEATSSSIFILLVATSNVGCSHTWQELKPLDAFGELLVVDLEPSGELLGVNRPRRTLTEYFSAAALALEGHSAACACLWVGLIVAE